MTLSISIAWPAISFSDVGAFQWRWRFSLSAAVMAPRCSTSQSMAPAVCGINAMVGTAGGRRDTIQYAPAPSAASKMTQDAQAEIRAVISTSADKSLSVADNRELFPDSASASIVQMNYDLMVALTHCPQCQGLIDLLKIKALVRVLYQHSETLSILVWQFPMPCSVIAGAQNL